MSNLKLAELQRDKEREQAEFNWGLPTERWSIAEEEAYAYKCTDICQHELILQLSRQIYNFVLCISRGSNFYDAFLL